MTSGRCSQMAPSCEKNSLVSEFTDHYLRELSYSEFQRINIFFLGKMYFQ